MEKRDDLQWLRSLAIIAVVCFHLRPQLFPYGFLGVDIFFVISGYLMTMILSKEPDTVTFYLRRIKRIFPIYFLIITIFFGIGYFKLLPSHFEFLKTEVLWSVFFINNFPPMFGNKEYFQMISEFKFFLHTWSLSVEIQFYLMAPFLIKYILSKSNSLHWTIAFGISSWTLQLQIPNNSVSFGFVFCRIWQFLFGTFAFLYSNQSYNGYMLVKDDDLTYNSFAIEEDNIITSEKEMQTQNKVYQTAKINESVMNPKNRCFTCLTFVLLVFTCFSSFGPSSFSVLLHIFPLLSTTLTCMFIILNNSPQPIYIPSFINSILLYIGDISYVIYLIHWPIIIFFKYLNINYGNHFIILCIFASTLFIHEFFEKPLAKYSRTINTIVIMVCCCVIALIFSVKKEPNLTSLNPIQLNEQEAQSCDGFYTNSCIANPVIENHLKFRPKTEALDRYCSVKLNPKSNKTIMITGNSFVYFQIRGILEAIKQSKTQFLEAYVITHPYCDLLVGELNRNIAQPCLGIGSSHDELLNVTRPNVIIHSGRIDQFFPQDVLPTFNKTSDFYFHEIKRQILHISSFTRRLIIIEPHPPFFIDEYLNPLTIAHTLLLKDSPRKFNISLQEFHQKHDPSWNRVKEAIKYCKNCITVPTQRIMCPSDNLCPMVDPISQIGLFCDKFHMTPRQSLKFVPSLIKAIDDDNPVFV